MKYSYIFKGDQKTSSLFHLQWKIIEFMINKALVHCAAKQTCGLHRSFSLILFSWCMHKGLLKNSASVWLYRAGKPFQTFNFMQESYCLVAFTAKRIRQAIFEIACVGDERLKKSWLWWFLLLRMATYVFRQSVFV